MAQPISSTDVTRLTRMVVILAISTTFAIVAALIGIYTTASSKISSIAVDARGVVIPVVPLSDPMVAESRVVGYAEECLRKAFSHDFLHAEQTIPVAQDCFKPESADEYAVSIQPLLKLMNEKRMVMAITIPRPPRVVSVYKVGGVVNWDVEAGIEIFFEGRNERISPTRSTVQMTIVRVPLEATPRGILISKFNVGSGK